jgi:hypothetical protein
MHGLCNSITVCFPEYYEKKSGVPHTHENLFDVAKGVNAVCELIMIDRIDLHIYIKVRLARHTYD